MLYPVQSNSNIVVLCSFYVEVNVAKRIHTFSKNCILQNGGGTREVCLKWGGCEGSDPKMGWGGSRGRRPRNLGYPPPQYVFGTFPNWYNIIFLVTLSSVLFLWNCQLNNNYVAHHTHDHRNTEYHRGPYHQDRHNCYFCNNNCHSIVRNYLVCVLL